MPIFLNWNDPITVTDLDQVVATGAIPMITWKCGAKDANVVAGRDDPQIDMLAAKLTQFQLPVFLRWFPDPGASTSNYSCLAGGGAEGYVAAYRHIHDRLVAAGTSNVSFVWSVDTTAPILPRSGGSSIRARSMWTGSVPMAMRPPRRRLRSRTILAPGMRSSPARSP